MHFEGVPREEVDTLATAQAMPMLPWITPAIASASPALQKNPQNSRRFLT
jgi:hypothetical protein